MPLVLTLLDPAASAVSLCGGKGANLAKLTQAGFAVPAGFVLTAQAYALFAAGASDLLRDVEDFPFDDLAALDARCQTLVAALAERPVPADVVAAIREHLAQLAPGAARGGIDTPVSVRSSATSEDLDAAAAAGQHETYLNTRGLDAVVARVRDCWASLWSCRAISYRRGSRLAVRPSMAVVIQAMAFCDVAGVGFSCNPITGNLREQVFDANRGLGESVVSGEAVIDHFVLDKRSGAVVSADIGEKRAMLIAAPSGSGTCSVTIDGDARRQPCLQAADLARLSRLLRDVEALYGFPQDIEWGIERGKLWLLQARPITRIPPRWTRDESAERFPSVITPLAWALVEGGFHRSLNHSFGLMGMPPFHDKWFEMFGHYIYGNQNAVQIYADGAASNLAFSSLEELQAALPLMRERYRWVQELPFAWSRDLDHYLMGIGELMVESLDDRPLQELWHFVLRVRDLGAEYFLPNIAISITQRTLYRVLLGILRLAVGDAQAPVLFDRLLAYCETRTGAINKELHRLARRIGAAKDVAARLERSSGAEFLAAGGFEGHPDLLAAFTRFLRDHGHREVEFDPYHPTWVEAPELVIENLRAMLQGEREDPALKERELKIAMAESEAGVLAQVPAELRFAVQEVIRLARVYTTLDDVEHYQTTRLTLPLRRGLRALGTRLMAMGVVDEPMDIYFAQYRALDAAVAAHDPAQWQRLRAEIQAEKAQYLRHRASAPAWEIAGSADRLDSSGRDPAPAPQSAGLRGLPGSPGRACGPVFRIFGREDFASFPKGAVLVARTTNPAWTPLFFKAAGVITECGGPLSHGAVTAREVGLPAVMSVRDVMSVLKDGEMVTVDGSAGRVERPT